MSEPTARPWKQNNLIVTDANGGHIAHCTRWDGSSPRPEEADANAALIVEAVNHYHAQRQTAIPTTQQEIINRFIWAAQHMSREQIDRALILHVDHWSKS